MWDICVFKNRIIEMLKQIISFSYNAAQVKFKNYWNNESIKIYIYFYHKYGNNVLNHNSYFKNSYYKLTI